MRSIAQLLTDNVVKSQPAPVALTGASNTISAAGIVNGLITINGGTAGAVTSTLVTAALLDTALINAFGGFPVNYSVDFSIINISTVAAEDSTITTAAGWTLVGNMTVASNDAVGTVSFGHFRARKTANNTFTLYRVG
jgi:hypothetical protein